MLSQKLNKRKISFFVYLIISFLLLHMRRSAVDAAVVVVDAGEEPCPFVAGAAVVQEGLGAVFAGPVVVADDVFEGDVVFGHEVGG